MLSSDRQSYWVHLVIDSLFKKGLIQYQDKDKVVRAGKRAMAEFMAQHYKIEQKVRTKILSLKRGVVENSAEWEVLYAQYYNDELSRSHLSGDRITK